MKKRDVILPSLCLLFILLSQITTVSSSGAVSPAYHYLDFEPWTEKEFTFTYQFDDNHDSEIFLKGDFAENTKVISEKNAFGRKVVTIRIEFPGEAPRPGLNRLIVEAREKSDPGKGVSVSFNVGGVINIQVPYPGKYAELALNVENVNAGDPLPYHLTVYSRGEEDIVANLKFNIYNENGLVDTIELEEKTIKSKESHEYIGTLATTKYQPGDYNLTAVVEFGGTKPSTATKGFRLGELKVRITNYTRELPADKVGRYRVQVESLWNDPIDGVYVVGEVFGYPGKSFTSPTISLGPWRSTQLNGFLDTTGIQEDSVDVDLTIHYAGNLTDDLVVPLKIDRGVNWTLIIIITLIILVILIILSLVAIIYYLIKKKK